MKRLLFSLLFIAVIINLSAKITYQKSGDNLFITGNSDYKIKTRKSGREEFIQIDMEDSGHSTFPGQADIPSLTKLVALPNTGNFVVSKISYDYEIKTLEKPLIPMGWEENISKNEEFYSQNSWYPKEVVKIAKPSIMRNYRFTGVTIFPIEYNPKKNQIKILKNIRITLKVDYKKTENSLNNNRAGLFSSEFYQIAKTNIMGIKEERNTENRNYLFIINSQFHLDELSQLIEMKRKLGYHIYTAVTDEIGSEKEDILNYIQNAYDNWEYPPENVILFGDTQGSYQMPSFQIDGTYTNTDVTDLPYSLLSGNDYFPDIMLGRISIRSSIQLGVIINKIKKYQTNPPMDTNWFETAVMGADTGYPNDPYMNLISAKETKELVKEKLLDYGYETIHTFYSPEDYDVQVFKDYINQGCSFVNYRGFGGPEYWTAVLLGVDMLTSQDIIYLTNGFKLPFITSIVCGGGDFNTTDAPLCFGETWLTAGSAVNPKGAIGFIGPSEHDTKTWFNNCNDSGIYQGITRENLQKGAQMLLRGKMELYRNFPYGHDMGNSHVSDQFYFYVYNLLGDPALTVWTKYPKQINTLTKDDTQNGNIEFTIDVDSPDKSGFMIAITNANSLFATGITNDEGKAILPVTLSNGEYTATASKQGYIPESTEFTIQNQNITLTSYQIIPNMPVAGESFDIDAQIMNTSDTDLSNIGISIEDSDSFIEITAGDTNISLLQPNETATLHISGNIAEIWQKNLSSIIVIKVSQNGEEKDFPINMQIKSPYIECVLDNNAYLPDNTENFLLSMPITNIGNYQTDNIILHLSSEDVDFVMSDFTIGNIMDGETIATNFVISIPHVPIGYDAHFQLSALKDNITMQTLDFSLPILINTENSPTIGYGYAALESSDENSLNNPAYDWVNAHTLGTAIPFDHASDDGFYTYIDLPFPINYYGREYNTITFSSAGWICMGHSNGIYFRNRTIPSGAGPSGMIAVFWDEFSVGNGYKYYDQANNRFILEWQNVGHMSSGEHYNFEVILYPSQNGKFSDILMQYQTIGDNDADYNYSTTGIESPDQSEGVLIQFAHQPQPTANIPTNNTAILFTSVENLPIPKISTDTSEFDFSLQHNQSNEFQLILTSESSNAINGNVKISYKNDSNWLLSDSDNFTVASQTILNFNIDTSSLIPGTYKAYLEVLSEFKQLLVIPVNLQITLDANEDNLTLLDGITKIYPNPFYKNRKDAIKITYNISKKSNVDISIYNLKGQKIKTLLTNSLQSPGVYTVSWDGNDDNGNKVSNGIYFYKLKNGNREFVKRCVIIK